VSAMESDGLTDGLSIRETIAADNDERETIPVAPTERAQSP
jgi:hypothetical protein